MRGRGLKKILQRQKTARAYSPQWQNGERARLVYADIVASILESTIPPEKRPATWHGPFKEVVLDCALNRFFYDCHEKWLIDDKQKDGAQKIIDLSKGRAEEWSEQMLEDLRNSWQELGLNTDNLPADSKEWVRLWLPSIWHDLSESERRAGATYRAKHFLGITLQYLDSPELRTNEAAKVLKKEALDLANALDNQSNHLIEFELAIFAENYLPEMMMAAWSLKNIKPDHKAWLDLAEQMRQALVAKGHDAKISPVIPLATETGAAMRAMGTFDDVSLAHVAITHNYVVLSPQLLPLQQINTNNSYPMAEHILLHEQLHLLQPSIKWSDIQTFDLDKKRAVTSLSETIIELNTLETLAHLNLATRQDYDEQGTGYVFDVALWEEIAGDELRAQKHELLSYNENELFDWQLMQFAKKLNRPVAPKEIEELLTWATKAREKIPADNERINNWRMIVQAKLAII